MADFLSAAQRANVSRLQDLTQLDGRERVATGEPEHGSGRSGAEPSSEIGSANSAPSLSPAVHLTTALARSRPGQHQPDSRADLEMDRRTAAMKPRSEILRTCASTPLAPSSRIVLRARPACAGELASFAMVFGDARLDHRKVHLHRPLLRRSRERQADAPVLHPPHLCRNQPPVKQLKRQPLTDIAARAGKITIAPESRDVDQPDHMLAAAKIQHRGARYRPEDASSVALVDCPRCVRGIIPPSRK